MWINIRDDRNPSQKALISLETAAVTIKRKQNPFTRRYYYSQLVAEYPNGKCIVLFYGDLGEIRQVMKAITMAVESGYHYLDLTQIGGPHDYPSRLKL